MCITKSQLQIQLIGTILIILVDGTYLTLQKDFYQPILALSKGKIHLFPGFLCWFLIIAMIQALVLSRPDVQHMKDAFFYGGLLGLAMYGVYNTTNLATISNWTWKVAIGDTLWGTLLTATTAMFLYWIRGKWFL